jgi:hypothetical protein
MRDTMPAMRRFRTARHQIATYGGLLAPAGRPVKLAPELVADVEAEGNALIGAVTCHGIRHGVGRPHDGEIISTLLGGRCSSCGAAL